MAQPQALRSAGAVCGGTAVIVCITGTGYPFQRLVDAMGAYAAAHPEESLWIQHGKAVLPGQVDGASMVPRAEVMERLRAADVAVCHGGSGAIADALDAGHIPVVVPRLRRFREHVNDHQLEIVDALAQAGRVIAVHDIAALEAAIGQARTMPEHGQPPRATADLGTAVARDLTSLGHAGGSVRSRLTWLLLGPARLIRTGRTKAN